MNVIWLNQDFHNFLMKTKQDGGRLWISMVSLERSRRRWDNVSFGRQVHGFASMLFSLYLLWNLKSIFWTPRRSTWLVSISSWSHRTPTIGQNGGFGLSAMWVGMLSASYLPGRLGNVGCCPAWQYESLFVLSQLMYLNNINHTAH